jgi:hypothetical protein
MATLRWLGRAAAVAQVTTLTVGGTVEAGDLFIVTVNGKAISVAATTTSTTTTATEVYTALAALTDSVYPEFAEFTVTNPSAGVVTLTGDTAGLPFTVTATTTESNGGAADAQTFIAATTTAATGPNHWDAAANWDTGSAPTTGDTVYIENSDTDILYGLDQNAVTLAALYVRQSFTGTIGLPEVHTGGAADYPEYRDTYLKISATILTVGDGPGQGSGRIKINTGSVATTLTVNGLGTPAEQDIPAMLWKGTDSTNIVRVYKGTFAAAWLGTDAANIATLNVGYQTSQASDVAVYCGNVTFATAISQEGGTLVLNTGVTTLTTKGGNLLIQGAGAYTTINNWGSRIAYRGTGAVTTLNLGVGSSMDYAQDMRARTVTNTNVYGSVTIFDPFTTVTFTNPPKLYGQGIEDVTIVRGKNITIATAAI